MAKRLEFFWVAFAFLLSNPVLSLPNEFLFAGFKGAVDSKRISLNGDAEIEQNGLLRLTNSSHQLIGRAFYPAPIRFKNSTTGKALSFSTAFAFAIVQDDEEEGGHGFAFAIAPTKELPRALAFHYLGLLNQTNDGNFSNHLFAVEFDTVRDVELDDINGNHVGVDLNSLVSNASVDAGYFKKGKSTKQKLNLKSGKTIQAWIDYDSTANQLNVTLSLSSTKPSSSILSIALDLSPIFKETMFVGFSASTGALSSYHYIKGWSFKMEGVAQSLDLPSLPSLPGKKQNHKALFIGVFVSAVVVVVVCAIGMGIYYIRRMENAEIVEAWELDIGPHRFSYKELKQATKDFRDEELIGSGGFGRVYKGTLPNSAKTQVAIKRISNEPKQGMREFASEIASIGRLRHRNLVQLMGGSRNDRDLLIVYDFMPNGSLDKYIFDEPKTILSWEQRFKIIKGVASGLLNLHEEWEKTVIHRDIKAGNVLLDSELNGRLGDFGLAKLYEHGSNPETTRVVGTLGYIAPELTRTGKPTTSSDVFTFGALLLEVVCRRRPVEPKALPEKLFLVEWVWERWKNGAVLEVVDPRLGGEYDEIVVCMVIKLGLICSNSVPATRPSMKLVVRYLEGEVGLPEEELRPPAEDGKNGGGGSGGGIDFEDFVHSSPQSRNFEKASISSSLGDRDLNVDINEASPPTLSSSRTAGSHWRYTQTFFFF